MPFLCIAFWKKRDSARKNRVPRRGLFLHCDFCNFLNFLKIRIRTKNPRKCRRTLTNGAVSSQMPPYPRKWRRARAKMAPYSRKMAPYPRKWRRILAKWRRSLANGAVSSQMAPYPRKSVFRARELALERSRVQTIDGSISLSSLDPDLANNLHVGIATRLHQGSP